MMTRFAIALFALAGLAVAADVTAESAGAPPSDLDPAITGVLQKEGVRIKEGGNTAMELWFLESAPQGPETSEVNVTIKTVPHGALLGVVRFPDKGSDRRGQAIKPGVYTARLSFFPPDGNHQGVAEQRDFLILSPASEDKDPKSTPDFDTLMDMSRKASGTAHPAVLSLWKQPADNFTAGVALEGEHDWILQHKIGDLPVGIVVVGTAAH